VQLIQYAVLSDEVLIWLVSKNNFAVFDSPVSAKELNLKINSYLESISDGQNEFSDTEKDLAKELYQILVAPVAEKLDSRKEIVFIPDKFLFRIPFSTLISPETGRFLVEDFTSFYSPSANVFLQSSIKAEKYLLDNKEKTLIIGNPAFDQNSFEDLPALLSAEKEAKTIATLYENADPVIGKEATKEKIKLEFPKAEIVHFAGHYIVDAVSPMQSFLLLAGGGDNAALSNYELMKEIHASDTKLIVLSACQTGVERYYNGEGMIGAARTFLGIGVPLVVASQWKVDSETTEILMSRFHKYRKEDNLSSTAALRRAQLDMLGTGEGDNKNYRKPFYWAAFAATGGHTKF
jgi:CHAT domain-containing protein